MLSLVRIQSRRILYSTFMFTILMFVGAENFDGGRYAFLLESPIVFAVSALIMALGFAICMVLFLPLLIQIPLLRELRIFPEFFLTWSVLYYGAVLPLLDPLSDGMASIVAVALFIIFWGVVQGPVLDRFDLRLLSHERASFVSRLDREVLWERLRPGRGPIESHVDSLLAEAEIDPENPDRVMIKYRLGLGTFEHQEITYVDETPNAHFLYQYRNPVEGTRQSLVEGEYEVWLTDIGNGRTKVTIENRRSAMRPNMALAQWFDRFHTDRVIFARNRLENRWDGTLSGAFRRKILSLS